MSTVSKAYTFLNPADDPDSDVRTDDRNLPWETDGQYGGWWGPRRFDEPNTASSLPIVFVHGKGNDADDWTAHASCFSGLGHNYGDFWSITFRDPVSRHCDMAAQLEAFVSRVREFTGSNCVNIIAHSLGVTGVRHWMHTYDRYAWVDTFIGVAGANHGIPLLSRVETSHFDNPERSVCRYLTPTDETPTMLSELNENETPGNTTYYTIRGLFDHYFVGDMQSPTLDGAERNVVFPVSHNGTRVHLQSMQFMHRVLDND